MRDSVEDPELDEVEGGGWGAWAFRAVEGRGGQWRLQRVSLSSCGVESARNRARLVSVYEGC